MSAVTERQAIEERFATAWGVTTPIAYGNVAFDAPAATVSWVKLSINNGETQQVSIGTGDQDAIHRSVGLIYVSIFTPLNKGENEGRTYAEQAATIFRNAVFSNITCYSPSIKVVGENGGFWQTNMSVAYKRDDIY